MPRLLIVAQDVKALNGLSAHLVLNGFACSIIAFDEELVEIIASQSPDLVMVEMDGQLASRALEFIHKIKQESSPPIMALVTGETLNGINGHLDIDDFVVSPYNAGELLLRTKRLLHREKVIDSGELIQCDGLVIDLAKCEVTIEGRIVELTFKEYELLKLLAGNPGRVYTREAVINKVWGYDYYGGDRTVDVHIRRLRSKIEDANNTFIETVRNIGYKFRENT